MEEEEDEIRIDIVSNREGNKGPRNYDVEFEQECGYWFIKMLRGSSSGRQLKRSLFKLSMYKLFYAIPVFIISVIIDNSLRYITEFIVRKDGSTLLELQFGTSILISITAGISLYGIKKWSSLVTNRELLVKFMYILMAFLVLYFILIITTISKLFNTFSDMDWSSDVGVIVLPIYIITAVLLFMCLIAIVYFGLDISFHADNISMGARIAEPEPLPDDTVDLSGITLSHLGLALLAMPLLLFEECREQASYIYMTAERGMRKTIAHRKKMHKKAAKARKSFLNRMTKTMTRFWTDMVGSWKERKKLFEDHTPLAGLTDASEELERDAAAVRLQELIKQREIAEEKARLEREEKERLEKEEREARTMTAKMFKSAWNKLNSAGSFQCKLKTPAVQPAFVEHLRKQAFHVVFVSNPATGGFEIGVCNVRENGEGPWFLARFLSVDETFSAVMKCEDPSTVTTHVKRFALAKVLRINTKA